MRVDAMLVIASATAMRAEASALSSASGVRSPTAIASLMPDLVRLDVLKVGPAKLWLVHHREAARPARVKLVKDWLKSIFDGRTRPWYRSEFVHPDDFEAPPARLLMRSGQTG